MPIRAFELDGPRPDSHAGDSSPWKLTRRLVLPHKSRRLISQSYATMFTLFSFYFFVFHCVSDSLFLFGANLDVATAGWSTKNWSNTPVLPARDNCSLFFTFTSVLIFTRNVTHQIVSPSRSIDRGNYRSVVFRYYEQLRYDSWYRSRNFWNPSQR